jgi:hypothetical protein
MTPEQINIKIAELCGWARRDTNTGFYRNGDNERLGIPDYVGDLNACAEFEATVQNIVAYTAELHFVVTGYSAPYMCANPTKIVRATAPQRCEAFLRTLGLWEETK